MKAPVSAISMALAASLLLSACGEEEKAQKPAAPAKEESTMTNMMDKAASSAKEMASKAAAEVKTASETASESVKAMADTANKEVQAAATNAANTVTAAVEKAETLLPGDAAKGEKAFKRCKACHSFKAGDKHKIGPNLFGVIGRAAGGAEGFEKKYSDAIKAYGAPWTEALVAEYVKDPTAFLKEKTGDPKAKGKMAFKLKKAQDRNDVAAYLATLK